MTTRSRCPHGGPTLDNGNCTIPGVDGMPVQCVGIWTKDKHHYLTAYIAATRAVRRGYLIAKPGRKPGGAAFVDLFAGPGLARIRETGEVVNGSPLIALAHSATPFSRVICCDLDTENVDALKERTRQFGDRVQVVHGDCNDRIDEIVKLVPPYGLNIALVDPYGLRPLRFETLARLGAVVRMDLIVHFPTADMKRNFANPSTRDLIDKFLGTDAWRKHVVRPKDVPKLIDMFKERLAKEGYGSESVRSLAIANSRKAILYHLVFASKHDRGSKIWNSIARSTPAGQRAWDF